jgi:uncharacterized protein
MTPTRFEAFFATPDQGAPGSRLFLWHAPTSGPVRALVVFVHPFAEEMNKSRRMAALQSRSLAAAGCAVLQMDLFGCGDSSGDFAHATWPAWVDDVVAACAQARTLHARDWPDAPCPPLWLWGLRAGCLLAAEAAARMDGGCNLLFWQPALQGKTVLQQLLRLKTAAAVIGKAADANAESPRLALAAGKTVSVAGYELGPELAKGLDTAKLAPPPVGGRLEWIELAVNDDGALSPAAAAALPAWQQSGWLVRQRAVAGPHFWQTTEIELAPELLQATLEALATEAHTREPAGHHMPQQPSALASV